MKKGSKVLVLNSNEAAVEGVFEGLDQVQLHQRVWQPAIVRISATERRRVMQQEVLEIVRVVTPADVAADPERSYVLVEYDVVTDVTSVEAQEDGSFLVVVWSGVLRKPVKEGAVLAEVP